MPENFSSYEIMNNATNIDGYKAEVESVLNEVISARSTGIKSKRVRHPSYKKDDRVQTPNGLGSIWSVEKDGTICVELDGDSNVLHEFEKKELKKIK
jgi:hypothetical protein